jgi:hypothetical protein
MPVSLLNEPICGPVCSDWKRLLLSKSNLAKRLSAKSRLTKSPVTIIVFNLTCRFIRKLLNQNYFQSCQKFCLNVARFDILKTIITLCSGLIALTVGFSNSFRSLLVGPFWKCLIILSFVLVVLALLLALEAVAA